MRGMHVMKCWLNYSNKPTITRVILSCHNRASLITTYEIIMNYISQDGTSFDTEKDLKRYNQKVYNQRLTDISDMLEGIPTEDMPRFLNNNLSLFRGLLMMKDAI